MQDKNIMNSPAGLALAILQGLYNAFGGSETPEDDQEDETAEEDHTETPETEGEEGNPEETDTEDAGDQEETEQQQGNPQETPTDPEEGETEEAGEDEGEEGSKEDAPEEKPDQLGETPEGTNDPTEGEEGSEETETPEEGEEGSKEQEGEEEGTGEPEGEEGSEGTDEAGGEEGEGETGTEGTEDLSEGEGNSQDKEGSEGEGSETTEEAGDPTEETEGEGTPGDQEGETEGAEGEGGQQEGSEGEETETNQETEVQTGTPGNPKTTLSQALETEGSSLAPQSMGYTYPMDKYTMLAMEYLRAWETVADIRTYPVVQKPSTPNATRTGYAQAPKMLIDEGRRQQAIQRGETNTEDRIKYWEQLTQETAATAATIAAGLDLPNHIQDSFVIGERSGEIDEDALYQLFDEDETDPRVFMQREARSIPKIAIAFVLDLSGSMILPSWVRPEHLTGRDAQQKMRRLMKYSIGGRRLDEARALLCATIAALNQKGINDVHVYGYEDENTNIHHIVTPDEGEGELWRIACADPHGGTRTPEAITYASRQLEKHHPDHPIKLVIVLSDGEDLLSKGVIEGSEERGFRLGTVYSNTNPNREDVKRNYISPTQGTTASLVRRGGKNLVQKFIPGTDIMDIFEDDQDQLKDDKGELFVSPNRWIYAACRESEIIRGIPVCGIAIFSGIGPNTVACAYGPGRGVTVNDAATAAPVISSFLSRVLRDSQ